MALTITPADTLRQLDKAIKAGTVPTGGGEGERPSQSELEDMAGDVLDVGKRSGKDDYDKRLKALINDYLPDLNKEDRGRLIGELYAKDDNASGSWLQGARLDKLVDDGDLSAGQRSELLQSLAAGYNDGHVDGDKAWKFLDMDDVDGNVTNETLPGKDRPSKVENHNNTADVFPRLLAGLDDGDGGTDAEFAEFIEKFSIDQIENGKVGDPKNDQGSRGDYLGLLINAADKAGPDQSVVNKILHGVSDERRAQLIDDVSNNFSKITTDNAWLDREDRPLPDSYAKDPMATLIRAVANDPDSIYGEGESSYAVDMAEYVYSQSDNNPWGDNGFFDDENIPKTTRQEALNDLMIKKGEEIFKLNGLDEAGVTEAGSESKNNMRVMANLERLTGLSPTSENGEEVLKSLGGLADQWSKDYQGGSEDGKLQAKLKLTHMVASTEQAVLDGFADKAEDDEARKADLARMLDFFTGFLPGGGSVSGGLSKGLSSAFNKVFGENSRASKVLDGVIENYGDEIDSGTSSAWKEKLVDGLFDSDDQNAYLDKFKDNANTFIEDRVLNGLSGDDYKGIRGDIVKEAAQLLDD